MNEDSIRRSDAIKVVQARIDSPYMQNAWQQGACLSILRAIEELPSADRPQGEWIECDVNDTSGYWKCSACGASTAAIVARTFYNFCPFCGADMKGADDEDN